ncbi:MAG TPA: LOG family protein [Acidimicrobiia bacterium]|jgi:hypothetical protein
MDDLPRYRTGKPDLDVAIAELVELAGPQHDASLIFEMVTTAMKLAREGADRGDLKILNSAVKEMRYAFAVFAPYRRIRKAAIFGSARTLPDDPLYDQARNFAAALASNGWMVITGAGPGIMTAGVEGAGLDHAFGVSIRLPFETVPASLFGNDVKLVNFRYFFTRKLTFVKESSAFVLLPGGFGTLDEALETLTLLQTGKAPPAPVVLLDTPSGTYWQRWRDFVEVELAARGYVSPHDLCLVKVTDSIDEAIDEVVGFYANYHSIRFVGHDLVVRMRHEITDEHLRSLNARFAGFLEQGTIARSPTTESELADNDQIDLPRLRFRFNRADWAGLREFVDALNEPFRARRPLTS